MVLGNLSPLYPSNEEPFQLLLSGMYVTQVQEVALVFIKPLDCPFPYFPATIETEADTFAVNCLITFPVTEKSVF
jgi:hypothetical protein